MKDKSKVYVPIGSKKEAKQAKAVLLALGEEVAPIYWAGKQEKQGGVSLKFNQDKVWIVSNTRYNVGEQITLRQLIEMLTAKPEKIAVEVSNEWEFKELMKHYDSLGWIWRDGVNPSDGECINYIPTCIKYNDNFSFSDYDYWIQKGYQIITYKQFAEQNGLPIEELKPLMLSQDLVPLFEGDEYHLVTKLNGKFEYKGEHILTPNSTVINKTLGTHFAFSTKQSALDWIEAQKPKEIELDFGTVKSDGIYFDIQVEYLMTSTIKYIYEAMQSLNKEG